MYFFKKLFTVSSNLNGIKEFNDVNQEQGWEGRGLGFFFDFFANVSVRMFRGRANCSDAFVDRTPTAGVLRRFCDLYYLYCVIRWRTGVRQSGIAEIVKRQVASGLQIRRSVAMTRAGREGGVVYPR